MNINSSLFIAEEFKTVLMVKIPRCGSIFIEIAKVFIQHIESQYSTLNNDTWVYIQPGSKFLAIIVMSLYCFYIIHHNY